MQISREIEIDMGHAVTDHNSKCKHLHGHRYKIRAVVNDKVITTIGDSSRGMVIDFSDLKQAMMDILDAPYDHAFVMFDGDPRIGLLDEAHGMWHNDPQKFHATIFIPTAENLAAHWFNILASELENKYKIALEELHVYETPNSMVRCTAKEAEEFVATLQ
ncbi:MAG: 6-carboxytetrahydropterin synthase [Actinobacteria bacterium]|nr:6-carboxytetrahydropterin synthase [Actinomycetota bacterium]MCA1806285.1 6-carboxytetrahydropterin synthase [Actinomycetota bacterium]